MHLLPHNLTDSAIDSQYIYMYKTMMVFGDAKKVVEDMVKAIE